MPDTLFLCRPCAEHMKTMQTVASVSRGKHVKCKGTCDQCCRRRYGSLCDVEFRAPSAPVIVSF